MVYARNSNLQHYKIHIVLNEIILLPNVNKFKKFDHNMECLSGGIKLSLILIQFSTINTNYFTINIICLLTRQKHS